MMSCPDKNRSVHSEFQIFQINRVAFLVSGYDRVESRQMLTAEQSTN